VATNTAVLEQERGAVPILVMGMGIRLFGKEKRVLRSLSRMPRLSPLFLLSSWDLGEVSSRLDEAGIPYRKATFGYLGFGHPYWTLKNVLLMPLLNLKVIAAQRDHRARILLFAEVLSFFNAIPAFLLLRYCYGTRIVFYLGDIATGTVVQRLIGRLADRFADTVIVNSSAVKKGLQDSGWTRSNIQVIYNGVSIDHFRNAEPLPRAGFSNWGDADFVFGFVGQIEPNKGIEDFLEAASIVSKEEPTARFLVIGDSAAGLDYPQEVRKRFDDLGDRVCWLGFVENVERYYKVMNCVVVASRHEDPAANVNLEGMASGIPVIATATGGSPELIEHQVTGLLVPPRDPSAMATQMLYLIHHPQEAIRMGEKGIARVASLFDVRVNARRVEDLILQTLIPTT
jgi:glycosyltransferase involved in cell wall biosynthesis